MNGWSLDTKTCANCIYLSFSGTQGLRCADPAAGTPDRPVTAQDSCGRFRLSFSAAKELAFRTAHQTRSEGWEIAMHRHLSIHGKDDRRSH
jgi:hypothetical protein